MKICPKCGVAQNDSNTTCVDCGAVLGRPLDDDAEYQIEKTRREKISDMGDRSDELSFGRAKLPLVILCIVGIVASIVLCALSTTRVIRFTEAEWLLYSILFFAAALGELLFPQLLWKLELWRLSWYIDTSDATPSFAYIFFNKLGVVVLLILGIAFIVVFFAAGEVVRPIDSFGVGSVLVDHSAGTVYSVR